MSDLTTHDLTAETYREYNWIDPVTGNERIYKIDRPVTLYVHPTATTHRIVDRTGLVHCVPSVGQLGCVLRWLPHDPAAPVQF